MSRLFIIFADNVASKYKLVQPDDYFRTISRASYEPIENIYIIN